MRSDFPAVVWDQRLEEHWRAVLQLAVREDLDRFHDWTTMTLVPDDAVGAAEIVAREAAVVAGMPAVAMTWVEFDRRLRWTARVSDGQTVEPGQVLGRIEGPARSILTAERTALNVLGRLCGVATLTRQYVDRISGTAAHVYDTRKTTPGWRLLEKYAVAQGGGRNHRIGLFSAFLIKDNHLAWGAIGGGSYTPAEAVQRAQLAAEAIGNTATGERLPVEIEVDSLEQLAEVLPAGPDIVLLDNMRPEGLQRAVELRNEIAPAVQLEASGGVTLDTIAAIAATGVERISVGALTHAPRSIDVGLDWR